MFDAAKADEPPPRVLRRTLGAVAAAGVATAVATHAAGSVAVGAGTGALGTGTAAGAKLGGGVLMVGVVKWGVVGLVGGVAVMGAVDGAQRLALEAHPAPVAASALLGGPTAVRYVVARPPSSAAAASNDEADRDHPPPPAPPAASFPAADPPSELAVEITMIERARRALQMGRSRAAVTEADAYARRFPAGQFGPEMAYIRMEALEQQGDHEDARRAARDLVARHPSGPQLLRAQQILETKKE